MAHEDGWAAASALGSPSGPRGTRPILWKLHGWTATEANLSRISTWQYSRGFGVILPTDRGVGVANSNMYGGWRSPRRAIRLWSWFPFCYRE